MEHKKKPRWRQRIVDATKSEMGAFDLPSIMMGVVVIGMLTIGVIVAIFGVIPWAQQDSSNKESAETPAPIPEPPSDPIVLPDIQNLEALWLIPLAVATVAGLYLFIKKVRRDQLAQRSADLENQRAEGAIVSRWEAVRVHHRELDKMYLDAETDWDMLFNYPALQDSSVPKTNAMIRAMMKAGRMDQKQPSTLTEDSDLDRYPYPQSVTAFEHAWNAAYEHAKKVGQSKIPAAERRTIKQIRQLLNLAENTGATSSERDLAHSRAQKLIGTLQSVHIPAKALQAIESHQRLAIAG